MLNALDFAETRSQEDAKLLGTARTKKKGDRLTEDEARALRRKVGGTASERPSANTGCHWSIRPCFSATPAVHTTALMHGNIGVPCGAVFSEGMPPDQCFLLSSAACQHYQWLTGRYCCCAGNYFKEWVDVKVTTCSW